jgi:1-acyl-sn-glycerol-3-phosphate acyltransferase
MRDYAISFKNAKKLKPIKLAIRNMDRSLFVFTHTLKYLKMAKAPNANYLQLKNIWAHEILKHFHIHLNILKPALQQKDGPLIYVGNHISYVDIPGLICACPELSFVAKKEVKYLPVIGVAAVRDNTIFVKRESKKSRGQSRKLIAEALLKNKSKVVIFPSGTTTILGDIQWRHGAFQIAYEYNIPIQPFRLIYDPLRVAAYIDDDMFGPHLWQLAKNKHIDLTIEFHEPVYIKDPVADCKYWQAWSDSLLPRKH